MKFEFLKLNTFKYFEKYEEYRTSACICFKASFGKNFSCIRVELKFAILKLKY